MCRCVWVGACVFVCVACVYVDACVVRVCLGACEGACVGP